MALTITSNGESSNIASAIVQRDSTGSFSASTINHNPSSANTSYITGTTYSLTGSSTTPMVDVSGTWNTTGVATLLKANLTNTASGSNSKLLDLQISGATRFSVYTTGNIDTNNTARIGYLAQTDVATVAGISIANYGVTFGATFTGMTNPGTAIAGYDGVLFSTTGVERMRLTSNLCLGATASAAVAATTFEIGANKSGAFGALGAGPVDHAYVSGNAYPTGSADPAFTAWKYTRTGASALYEVGRGGTHLWYTAASGTAAATVTFLEKMRLDSSGRLLVGTSTAIVGVNSQQEQVQLYGTGGAASSYATYSISDTLSANIRQYRARAGTTALLAGDAIGVNSFVGYTGTAWANVARIVGTVDSVSSGNLAGRMTFDTANTSGALIEAMRIDSSGNLGLGMTPSAWSISGNLQLTGNIGFNGAFTIGANIYYGSGAVFRYTNNGVATYYQQVSGQHIWFNAPSGTAGNAVSATQAMTLDASGNLGLGVAPTANERLRVEGTEARIRSRNSTSGTEVYVGAMNPNEARLWTSTSSNLTLGTNNLERMIITSSGSVAIGTSSPASKFAVYGGASGTDTRVTIGNAATALQLGVDSSSNALIATNTANNLAFYVNNTQRGYFAGSGLTVSDTVTAKQYDWTNEYGVGFITPTLDHVALAGGSLVLGDGVLGDVLAFKTPTTSEYWNGTAWSSTTNLPGCFKGKLAFNFGAVYSLTSTNTRVRWTWNSWGYHFWDAFVMSGSANGNNLYLTVETSTNGTTWVTQINDQSFGGSWPGYHFYRQRGNNSSSNPYLRITVRRDSVNSNNVDIANFSVISAYSGMNRLIDWDADRHLTIYGNIASTKFKFDNEGSGVLFGYNSYLRFYNTNSNAEVIRILNSGGLAVGTTADPGAGAIYATGNITAYYSDRRLKTNIKSIDNALNKVLQLNGITYNANDIAKSFGYNQQENLVGLFADEVDKVLPEAVKPAPFDLDENGVSKSGENYKTIQYEKLIPLLIEAIKEQQKIITDLKIKISNL